MFVLTGYRHSYEYLSSLVNRRMSSCCLAISIGNEYLSSLVNRKVYVCAAWL